VFFDPYKKNKNIMKLEWITDAVERDAALQNIECISYDLLYIRYYYL